MLNIKKILCLIFLLFFIILVKNKYYPNLNKIKIGIMYFGMKNGGAQKQTSLLLQELSKIVFFKIYLLTREVEIGEYYIPKNVTRLIVYDNLQNLNITIFLKEIAKHKIDILIYQNYRGNILQLLQTLKIKVIIVNRNSIFHSFYRDALYRFKETYFNYINFQLVLNLIPIEGNLYREWGIKNTITFMNLLQFDIKNITPSNLSSKNIIMFGRGDDPIKNFDLGIKTMKYIVQKIPEAKLFIVSYGELANLKQLVEELNIEKNVIFAGYRVNLSDILKNSSLNLFLSYAEAFPNVLSESKIYGVPTILLGMEYMTLFKDGTVLVKNDFPETIADAAIKILKDEKYRKKLGKEARKSVAKIKNEMIVKRWVHIIKAIYKGKEKIQKIINEEEKIDKKVVTKILEKEIIRLKIRKPKYKYLDTKKIFNLTYLCNIS